MRICFSELAIFFLGKKKKTPVATLWGKTFWTSHI
jgi:hypothetical protein